LTHQNGQANRSGQLGIGRTTLDPDDVWMVRSQLSRVFDNDDPLMLRHQGQQGCKQGRLS